MNNIIRSLGSSVRKSNVFVKHFTRQISMVPNSRSLWYTTDKVNAMRHFNVRLRHTSVEKQLSQFLDNEIKTEEKTCDKTQLPKTFEGFTVAVDNAEVELSKDTPDETISVKFNINHSVSEEETKNADEVNLRSKPDFEIDINRDGITLGFNCSFVNNFESAELDEPNDEVFQIDEITIYEDKFSDNKYSLAGDTVDPDLYDLLMTFLEEKGISNSFVENLSDLSTSYEQKVYVRFLKDMRKFF